MITVEIIATDIMLKRAKAHTTSARVYVPKEYKGVPLNVVPVHFRTHERDIEELENGLKRIVVQTNEVLRKVPTTCGVSLAVNIPKHLNGIDVLIFPSEDIEF